MEISGQIALVTGAGSGLGEATARRLAAAGARVAVVDRGAEAAERVADEIGGLAIAVDVSDNAAVEAAFAEVASKLGTPRIVVNCAGIGTAGRILPRDGVLPIEAFERTLRVNLLGSYIVLSHAARLMSAAEPLDADGARGLIVNTASVAYQDGQIGQAAYAASKGGIASLTLPAARELARFGIRVMTIAPGLFETAMSAGLPPEARTALEAGLPFPSRMGKPDEFALLVQQIVENPLLNGEVIRLDSAVRLAPK
ncbi:MAG: SDR family NAD(P)-dependent oxidoreductase [Rhodobacteraceae bacterium]|uniref:NAD(P)-dependent dehydrogenase, short-chain alcohol dehydrogenase family n=1 Tax=Salipiger thiooxidans TaxID=282683 RepID=A0A1G7CA96_9RHOB|nr:SDR family NAD(P)-dependent oxidoreductase [Salipiger thiooxidans]MAU45915.1 3-hydroxyacyl-CoA dehydrogenase [Salipiger sp.]NVK62556.1 SDR family NAD(P)-dependent oxidoreductase [Paracoccaceae bacterium]SDE36302.1 NAD(P)-dependent dehydrogenase, short-chain alcohol dehydrogenase family [Salipiger thiooxidans]